MNLRKDKWNKKEGREFNKYLESFKNEEKIEWSRRIVNTQRPMLAIKTPLIKDIAKEISEGEFFSFLDLELDDFYENIAINGFLITKIKEFDLMKKYLDKYVVKIENCAACDLLSFDVKKREEDFFNLSSEYIKSDKLFVRRVGLFILFNFISNDDYIDRVFEIMNQFYEEEHYYVNMMNGWLFCECFIKRRERTIKFLKNHKLNKFTINKGISKCRDSYRVSKEDKEMLLQYRKK